MDIPHLQILKPRFLRTVRRNGCRFLRTDAAWRAPNVTPRLSEHLWAWAGGAACGCVLSEQGFAHLPERTPQKPRREQGTEDNFQEHAENLGSPRGRLAGPRGDPCIMMRMLAAAPADPRGDPYILIQVAAAAPADPRGDPYILINQGHPGSWNVHGSMHNRRTPTLTLAPPVAQPALQPASFDQLPLISAAPPVAGRLFSIRKG